MHFMVCKLGSVYVLTHTLKTKQHENERQEYCEAVFLTDRAPPWYFYRWVIKSLSDWVGISGYEKTTNNCCFMNKPFLIRCILDCIKKETVEWFFYSRKCSDPIHTVAVALSRWRGLCLYYRSVVASSQWCKKHSDYLVKGAVCIYGFRGIYLQELNIQ